MSRQNPGDQDEQGPDQGPGSPAVPATQAGGETPRLHPRAAPEQEPLEEKDLWMGRGSWQYQFGAVAVCVLTALGALAMAYMVVTPRQAWLAWVAWLLILLVVLRTLWIVVVHMYSTRYRLTTQRLFVDRGILSRATDQLELIRVDDVRIHQRFLDRLFNVGTVEVLSTDVSDAKTRIIGIREPDRVAEHIRQHMRALRRRSLFIENL